MGEKSKQQRFCELRQPRSCSEVGFSATKNVQRETRRLSELNSSWKLESQDG